MSPDEFPNWVRIMISENHEDVSLALNLIEVLDRKTMEIIWAVRRYNAFNSNNRNNIIYNIIFDYMMNSNSKELRCDYSSSPYGRETFYKLKEKYCGYTQ